MEAIEMILQRMTQDGLRITEQRKTLIQIFNFADGYLAPKEVYLQMKKVYSGLSFDTVYRNLRLLLNLNILEQVTFEDGIKFRLNCGEPDHHHHMICQHCGKTLPLRVCPMPIVDLPANFEIVNHKFEVFGFCRECQAKRRAMK